MSFQTIQSQPNDHTCSLCQNPPDENMVKCSVCKKPFHQICVQSANDLTYKCQQCTTRRPESPHSFISHRSSQSRRSQSARIELQLQRLEEERALNKKRLEDESHLNQKYLNDKYQLLEEQMEIQSNNSSLKSQSVQNWLKDIPEVNKANNHQNPPDCNDDPHFENNNTDRQALSQPEEIVYLNMPSEPPNNLSSHLPQSVELDKSYNNYEPVVQQVSVVSAPPVINSSTTKSATLNCTSGVVTTSRREHNLQTIQSTSNDQRAVTFDSAPQNLPHLRETLNHPQHSSQRSTLNSSNLFPHTCSTAHPLTSTRNLHPTTQPNTYERPPQFFDSLYNLSQSQINARQSVPKELPCFTGQPEEWPIFISTFHWSTQACGFTEAENLIRLQKSIKGNALQSVQQMLVHPSNVVPVMEILEMLYGQPDKIINSIKNRIKMTAKVNENNLNTLTSFAINVRSLVSTINASNLTDEINNSSLLHELLLKLPSSYQMQWAAQKKHLINAGKSANLCEFDSWMFNIGATASSITVDNCYTSENKNQPSNKAYIHSHKEEHKCIICNSNCVSVDSCQKYHSLDRGDKWGVVRAHQLCKYCLHRHKGECRKKVRCGMEGCEYFHHTSLHRYSKPSNVPEKETSNKVDNCVNTSQMHNNNKNVVNSHSAETNTILFKIIPVKVFGSDGCVETFAFIDEGSSISLMDESVLNDLKLQGVPNSLCLRWTGGIERTEKSSKKLRIEISGTNSHRLTMEVCTVSTLNLPTQSMNYELLSQRYSHLRNLPIQSYKDAVPKLLIGLNHFNFGIPRKIHEGSHEEPVAACTRLGWIVYGAVAGKPNINMHLNVHACDCSEDGDDLEKLVRSFYSLDSVGISTTNPLIGENDKRALDLLHNFTKKKENGHYEVPLLWKFDNIELPDSYRMCLRRLICLERKLKQNPDLNNIFKEKIKSYLCKGYIRKLCGDEVRRPDGKVWYLPIFAVFNKNKPGKSRVVWDAAAKTNGLSLNSFLLKGPDLLASLPAILLSFRQRAVAICGDIEEMFHQVLIRPEDRDVQRFLWRDCDPNRDPDVYVMDVMIFGATCAPSISQYVKNLNATEHELDFPSAAKSIKDNHYVDDLLDSVDTPQEAIQLIADISYIHRKAGFNMRNWISNNKATMKSLPYADPSTIKCLNLGEEKQIEKVLGIFWEHHLDIITFKISTWLKESNLFSSCKTPTKREMLRVVMSIYDPLGLVGYIIMYVKMLLQEVWRAKIDWDECIPDELMVRWTQWINVLPEIQNIKIPRCYLQCFPNYDGVEVQLHTFVDASRDGYAAVCYFRLKKDNTVICSLIGSKTKVAPLKITSVPRLELMAALIGARFASFLTQKHKIKIAKQFYWSDSKTVLSWINSDHRKYQQFVAFRIAEILDLSSIKDWRWIPSKLNVADDATKWNKLPNISGSNRWFLGPDFLLQPETNWPATENIPESTEEEKIIHVLNITKYDPIFDVYRFSKWNRLVRSTAYALRFIYNCNQSKKEMKELTQYELKKAEIALYMQAQREHFASEIICLKSEQPITKKSELYTKSPRLQDGILRVDTRIVNANISEESKYPIILPKESYITKLIILHYHEKYAHMNHETAVNEIRQIYAIARLRTLFKSIIRSCQMCKIRKAVPQNPQMAKLPRARVASYEAPFTFTGIDFFGPIAVKVNRHTEKRYGCLFTCLTVRAVHIEVAHSLTTDSCIMAIRNFMARRGIPHEFYSDNGTNFVGAERELREALADVDRNIIIKTFTTTTCKWNFNPPASPHMGGAWERLVRSVKTILYSIMPTRSPSDELLLSMLIEVENVINSRPLAYVPIDDISEEAVTPNHFLIGSSSGMKPMTACDDSGVVLRRNWLVSQQYANIFWKKWIAEYLPTLACRSKWHEKPRPLCQGDLVIIVDPSLPRNVWIRGKILETRLAKDGQVRSAKVQTQRGIMERPATRLAILEVAPRQESASEDPSCHTAGGMLPPAPKSLVGQH